MLNRRMSPTHQSRIGHDRWLVSYADFITLLFGFFVVLYSVSQVNENKYKQLSRTLTQAFHPAQGQMPEQSEAVPAKPVDVQQPLGDPQVFAEQLHTNLAPWVDEHQARITSNGEWVEIDLNANWLFASGSAAPSEKAQPLLQALAKELAGVEADISVFGHTDNQPIKTAQFGNNWALSAARAVAVVDLLAAVAIDPGRLSAVGYGEFRPLESNDTEEGRARNRRVVLRLNKTSKPDQPSHITSTPIASTAISANTGASEKGEPTTITPVELDGGGLLFTSHPSALGK